MYELGDLLVKGPPEDAPRALIREAEPVGLDGKGGQGRGRGGTLVGVGAQASLPAQTAPSRTAILALQTPIPKHVTLLSRSKR